MKRSYYFIISFILFITFSVPVFAEETPNIQWPPPVYDMPRVAYDSSAFDVMEESLKITMGSITNIGFLNMGVCISVVLISSIFFRLVLDKLAILRGVDRKEFQRKVNKEDFRRNLDSIVDDKVRNMEAQYLAKNRFRLKHPGLDLEERIYQKQLSYQADVEFQKRHPEMVLDSGVRRRAANAQANIAFSREHGQLEVESRIQSRYMNMEAQGQVNLRNPNTTDEEAVFRRQRAATSEIEWRERFPKTARKLKVSRRKS